MTSAQGLVILNRNNACSGLGRPLPHEGGGSHPNRGSRLHPQAQQAMGVAPMGLGMYPGVMPYGMVPQPGMHHQVCYPVLYLVLCEDACMFYLH